VCPDGTQKQIKQTKNKEKLWQTFWAFELWFLPLDMFDVATFYLRILLVSVASRLSSVN
jgi:hypothetical protein